MLIFEWNCIENIYYFRLPQFWSTPGWTSSTARGCPTSWCRTWWPPTSSSGSGRSSSPPTTSSTRRWRPTMRLQILPHSSKTASQGAFIYYVRFHHFVPLLNNFDVQHADYVRAVRKPSSTFFSVKLSRIAASSLRKSPNIVIWWAKIMPGLRPLEEYWKRNLHNSSWKPKQTNALVKLPCAALVINCK